MSQFSVQASRIRASPSVKIAVALCMGQAAVYGVTPIISRVYTPEEVGVAGQFLAAFSILGALSTFRWEMQLAACDELMAPRITKRAVASIAGVTVLSAVGAIVIADVVTGLLFATCVASVGTITLSTQWAARRNSMNGIAMAKFVQGLAQAGTQVGSGAAGVTRLGLQIGLATGYGLSALVQVLAVRPLDKAKRHARAQWTFPRTLWLKTAALTLAAAINLCTVWAQLIIVSGAYDEASVGHFSLAQRLSIAPAGLAVAALAPPLIAKVGGALRSGEDPWQPIRNLLILMAPMTTVSTIGLASFPESWIVAALGPEWGNVKTMILAISPLILGLIVVGPVSQILAILGRAKTQILWDATRAIAVFGTGYVATKLGLTATAAVFTTSLTLLAWYVFYVALVRHSINKPHKLVEAI